MFDTSLETSGIFTVDSHYTGELVAAIYVMIENDEVAIIETGTSASVEHIERVITDNGLTWDNVKYVIPTHVHLDHSAGAGVLMQKCSNANLVIHPRGARHMADPSKLIAGATAVYGEYKFRELYGEITPIDELRIIALASTKVDSRSSNVGEIRIDVSEFKKAYGLDHGRVYSDLRDAVKSIMRKPIRLFDGKEVLELAWLSSNRYRIDDGSYIMIKFSNEIENYLFELKDRLTSIHF